MGQYEGYILQHIYMGYSSGISWVLCGVEYNSIEKVKNVSEEWYLLYFQINLACFV